MGAYPGVGAFLSLQGQQNGRGRCLAVLGERTNDSDVDDLEPFSDSDN